MLYLARLRQITPSTLYPYFKYRSNVPTSLTVDGEELRLASASALVVPALAGRERQLVVEWFGRRGRRDVACSEERFGGHRNLADYHPNWFIRRSPHSR
jgi:hypothetical protein